MENNLTSKELKLISDALDILSKKPAPPTQDMIHEVAKHALPKQVIDSPEYKRAMQRASVQMEEDKLKHEQYIEDVKILMGKVTAFKREVEEEEKQKAIDDLQK
jgi:hypothetical protein